MFGVLLKLLPTLRWPTLPAHDVYNEQLAIDTCISAVQIYFPCEPSPATNYTSLCEQYIWRVACYDNHASTPDAYPDRATAETEMSEYCHAAGSIGAETVQRQYHAQRRQINSILSSIGGQITSFLSSASITIELPTLASNTAQASSAAPAVTTPQSSAAQSVPTSAASTSAVPVSSAGSSATTPTRSLSSSLVTKTSSDPSQSTTQSTSSSSTAASSSSSKSSGPSAGLIAGAVIGGVAVLVLLGILIMLILRHKRRKSHPKPSTIEHGDATTNGTGSYRGDPSVETIAPVESRIGDEKAVYQSRSEPQPPTPQQQQAVPLPRGNEMATSANVWELDGRERPAPAELEAQHTYIPYRTPEAKAAQANGALERG